MSKSISVAMQNHLAQTCTTLARMWKIVRIDGQVFTFTAHDVDIVFDGHTYKSTYGFSTTAIAQNSDLSVDNQDIQGIFDDADITIEDLRAGKFDFADVYIFLVNWADISMGDIKMRRGKLGECRSSPQGYFTVEMRGMSQAFQNTIIDLYQPTCRVDVFSTKCGLDPAAWVSTATVTAVTDQRNFTVTLDTTQGNTNDDTWFVYGVSHFTAGDNDGRAVEVKSWNHTTGAVELFVAAGYPIQVGDTLDMYPGCDKFLATCRDKFNNILNMRAEPYLPGNDQTFLYPNANG